jgi:HKD family nuclease
MAFCTTNGVKSFFTELDEVKFSGAKTDCGES